MNITKFLIYQRSMLYDKEGKETVCFYVEQDSWSNAINEALFFDSAEKANDTLKEMNCKAQNNGYPKSYLKEIVFDKVEIIKLKTY